MSTKLRDSITANFTQELLESGRKKITWAKRNMPIMRQIITDCHRSSNPYPLAGLTIALSIHMEAKTARLAQALAELGAEVYATGCNVLSTQDDVAIALSTTPNVTVFAKHGCSEPEYQRLLKRALAKHPHVIIDDGGDLVLLLHNECAQYADRLIGGCEETTTGVKRLKVLGHDNELKFPMIAVNDANCKHLFDNHYGTGQSVLDGIVRTTNLIIAGKTVVVAGYGDCGSGIAKRFHGQGARIIVTEVDPIKSLRAKMEGYEVMKMDAAAPLGDIFITATGCEDVIVGRHFKTMKDGAILANAGHFNVEINLKDLRNHALKDPVKVRNDNIDAYNLPGKTLYLLAEGRLVNLAAADGHAVEIMDMSFALQLLSVLYIVEYCAKKVDGHLVRLSHFKPGTYDVPSHIDEKVANIALRANHITIDELTAAQHCYLGNKRSL